MKYLNKKMKLILLLLILINSISYGQSDSTRFFLNKHKYFGIDLTFPNFSGAIDKEFKAINFNTRSALVNYSPKLNYGIHYSVEKIFMNSPRFSIIPEIGFNFISGQIKLRKYSGAISESNTVFEDQLDINFYSLFLYSAYAVQYELFKNSGIGIFVAPKMSIRILNKGDILLEKYTVDYDKSPINREFNGSQEINAGYDLSGFQSFIEIGFNKSIPMKSNLLKFGIKYGLPLVYLYSPVNFKSNPISLTIKYGFAN